MAILTEDTELPRIGLTVVQSKIYPLRAEIRDACKKACDKFEGVAQVDDNYVFVDLRKYEIIKK